MSTDTNGRFMRWGDSMVSFVIQTWCAKGEAFIVKILYNLEDCWVTRFSINDIRVGLEERGEIG